MNNLEAIKDTECFLFDLDGTVYLGDELLPGARKLLAYLDDISRPYFFLTNNSSKSQGQDFFVRYGHRNISEESKTWCQDLPGGYSLA